MELTETVIGTEEIFRGRIISVRVDRVRLSDGRESTREVVQHNGAVCIVAIKSDGNLLMVRQFRLPAGKPLLEIPAGKLEPGEDPYDAAGRELEEETGYRATKLDLMFSSYLAPGYSTELIHTYLATDLVATQTNPDEDEDLEIVTVPLTDIVGMIASGEIQDAKTISGCLYALHLRNQA